MSWANSASPRHKFYILANHIPINTKLNITKDRIINNSNLTRHTTIYKRLNLKKKTNLLLIFKSVPLSHHKYLPQRKKYLHSWSSVSSCIYTLSLPFANALYPFRSNTTSSYSRNLKLEIGTKEMACCGGKPNRSDVHLSEQQQAEMEETTRKHFDALAPKRHSKPQRSDYSSTYTDSYSNGVHGDGEIPEFLEFQRLEQDQQVTMYIFMRFNFLRC